MTKATRPPIPYQAEPTYPTLDAALSYAKNLRLGAPGASAMSENWALYWLSASLDIVVIRLQTDIYSVVAFPPGSLGIAEAGQYDQLGYFRGWLLRYDSHHARWCLLARSQEVGTLEFIRLRRELAAG